MLALNLPRTTTIYKIGGTETFRASSAAFMETWGSNLQNIEKSMRGLYYADDGKVLVQVDQSGAEALIVAYLCKKARFRELFLHGVKPHVFVAMHVFMNTWGIKLPDLQMHEFVNTPIPELKKLNGWKQLDTLIKASDNWPPRERYYYIAKMICHACVDDETEVLKHDGWHSIKTLQPTDKIAVWNPSNKAITMETPSSFFITPYFDEMHYYSDDEIDQFVTPNHKMIYWSNDKFTVAKSHQTIGMRSLRIPNNGNYIGGSISLGQAKTKLLVAIQADGYIASDEAVRFRFVKQRKIERLRQILIELKLNYTERLAEDSVTEFYVHGLTDLVAYFKPEKLWGCWLLTFDQATLTALVDELKYWDGTYEESHLHKREAYFTRHKQNAEWIKTICHLVGKQGTLNKFDPVDKNTHYTIGINNRCFGRARHRSKHQFNGFVYCPTVSTGFFLIRRKGKISVTGNSNYGINANAFQMNVLEKSRGKIVLTKKQAEGYLAHYHSLFPEIHDWHRAVQKQVEETKMLFNLQGYPRLFTGIINEQTLKEAYAFVPQSTVGCITHLAVTAMQRFIEQERVNWDILGNCHDSYLVQCPAGEEVACGRKMKELIEQELTSPWGERFRMRSEAQSGRNWGPWKKDKNEDGLKDLQL